MTTVNRTPYRFSPRNGLFFIAFAFVSASFLRAQAGEPSAAVEGGFTDSTALEMQLSSQPELKFRVIESLTFPFLQGDGPLTAGNNIKTDFIAEVSPVSVNGIFEAAWTPIAFFQTIAGARAGSGWNIKFFDSDIYGIGVNAPKGGDSAPKPRKTEVKDEAFDGLLWGAWGGGALQFDLGALIPGDWTHVLFRSAHVARYAAYTGAKDGESWFYEFDYGENRNGWVYYGSYVLGYQMPRSPVLNTIAFMAEIEKNLYNTPGGDYWGDSLGEWILSGLFNFTITPRFGAILAVQLHTRRNHGDSDLENADMVYYQDLKLHAEHGKRRLVFYRTALLLNYKLR
jgi:hypothetical protein